MHYKVVSKNLTSAIYIARDLGLETQYVVGQWVSPHIKQAPLMVFEDLELAKRFINANSRYGPHRIFECEIKKSRKKWGWISVWNIDVFYKALRNKKKWTDLISYGEFPDGTVFADEVMLVKEII